MVGITYEREIVILNQHSPAIEAGRAEKEKKGAILKSLIGRDGTRLCRFNQQSTITHVLSFVPEQAAVDILP